MEGLADGKLVERLEVGPFGNGKRKRPVPASSSDIPGAMDGAPAPASPRLEIEGRAGDATRHGLVREQPLAVVVVNGDLERELPDPARQWKRTLEGYLA